VALHYCQLCRRPIVADFGDPHLCPACIDERLDERFARWGEDREIAFAYRASPTAVGGVR
jgi:hypothetical protein